MKVGEYLIKAVQKTGTRHVFGIQGDYVLNFYDQLYKSPLKLINTCSEQGAGFAADAYARMTGFGAVCVTYGVGGLNLANTTAQAFAERSPVLIISGAPGMSERQHDALLHHKVKSFESQLNVFREMTVAQAVLGKAETAPAEIDRVIRAIQATKKPGYIELPRDMVMAETGEPPAGSSGELPETDREAIDEAVREIESMLAASKRPMVMVGIEIQRFGLQQDLLKFLEISGFPFVTGILGKSVISEDHPQFVGVYAGAMTPKDVRQAVEESDCLIAVGPLVTDLSTGIFTQHIDPSKTIFSEPDGLKVKHHFYPSVGMKDFFDFMTPIMAKFKRAVPAAPNREIPPFVPVTGKAITVERFIACVNAFLSDETVVIAEAGDSLCAALDLRVHGKSGFMSPAYYASLGFAVPAAVGVQCAASGRRPLVIAGDGAFQMTGMEITTAIRYGLNPIIVVLNNGGYGTFRHIIDGAFNDIQPWHYAEIPKMMGAGEGYTVTKENDLAAALAAAKKNGSTPTVIDVHIGRDDYSSRLRILSEKLGKRVK